MTDSHQWAIHSHLDIVLTVIVNTLRFTLPLLLATCLLFILQGEIAGHTLDADMKRTAAPVEFVKKNLQDSQINDTRGFDHVASVSNPESSSSLSYELPKYNDPYYSLQWSLIRINMVNIHAAGVGTPEIRVAILDTGIDQDHEDLQNKVIESINFSSSGTTYDVYGHGTHVAGIIAAEANNGRGIAGIAPFARLLNIKVADDRGRCESSAVAQGIIWATDHGARVINLSLEIKNPSQELQNAIDYAWVKGAVLIAAGSNENGEGDIYPARYSNCIAVTATRPNDTIGPVAAYPEWMDVAAPGFNIYSAMPGNTYGYKSGTSFATAHVSGMAALLFSLVKDDNNDGKLNDEVRFLIEKGAVPVDSGGLKRISIFDSLTLAESLGLILRN